jgi:hypothetical protein
MARKITSKVVNLSKISSAVNVEKVSSNSTGSNIHLYKGASTITLTADETNKLLLKLAGEEFADVDPSDTRLNIKYSAGRNPEECYWHVYLEEEFDFFPKIDSEITPTS